MPRPAGPWWWNARGCWAATIKGKRETEKSGIGEFAKPMKHKVPLAVLDWYDRLTAAAESSVEVDPHELTVELMFGRYLKWATAEVAAGRLKRGTLAGHSTKLGRFCAFRPEGAATPCGHKLARSVTATDLAAAVEAWQSVARRGRVGYAPNYIRGLVRAIQTAFSWAARPVAGRHPERLLAANPLAGYRAPGVPRGPNRYLAADRFRKFLRWGWRRAVAMKAKRRLTSRFDRVFVLMLQFLRHSGARPGEACDLRWGDIHWDKRVAVLPPERWKNGRKTGRTREIPLSAQSLRILRVLSRQAWRHETHVFAHRRGNHAAERGAAAEQGEPWNSTAAAKKIRDWREWAAADGVPIDVEGPLKMVAYVTRHTYISDGLMVGYSNERMAASTGTSAQMVDSVYGHVQRDSNLEMAVDLAEKRRKLS